MNKNRITITTLLLCTLSIFAMGTNKNAGNVVLTGVVSDVINGRLIDSVKVSCLGKSTFTNAQGFFSLGLRGKNVTSDKNYILTFTKQNFDTLQMSITTLQNANTHIEAKMRSPYPLRNIFYLFKDPKIPARGPHESDVTPKCADVEEIPEMIGGQLKRHNLIYIGENYRRICVVIDGKLAWKYDTEDSWEDDEVWVLSNGNILHAHMTYIEEITPQKEVVWRYDNPKGTEIHTCQPIGLDKVLFLQNQGNASLACLYNKVTGKFEIKKELKELSGNVHGQCRRFRLTAKGTYVAATLAGHTLYEYDKDFNLIWTMQPGPMWGGILLKNGNYLIQNEQECKSIELNRAGEVVWEVSIKDIQPQLDKLAPGLGKVTATQTCERLANGNTVIFTRFCDSKIPQAIEVTPDKKVVWILQDWKHLGDGLSAQFLDEPGYPEIPGDTNH